MLWTACNCGWCRWSYYDLGCMYELWFEILRDFTDYRDYMGISSMVRLCKRSVSSLIWWFCYTPLHGKLLMRSIFCTNHFISGRRSCDKLVVLREPSWLEFPFLEVDSSFPFHPSNLAPILSIKGCTSILRCFWIWSGDPDIFQEIYKFSRENFGEVVL